MEQPNHPLARSFAQATSQSFADVVTARLAAVCADVGFARQECADAASTLADLLHPWGADPIGERPHCSSHISDDHFPLELSLVLDGSEPEVRVLFEARADQPGMAARWSEALALNARLERRMGVDTAHLRRIEDLFEPEDPNACFAMWHAVCFRPRKAPKLKVYVNPQAQGRPHAPARVTEALRRLGFAEYAAAFSDSLEPGDELRFFSLDLERSRQARAKVYRVHHHATRHRVRAHLATASHFRGEVFDSFWRAVVASEGPFSSLPISTYFALLPGDRAPSGATIHFPTRAYADSDAVVYERLSSWLPEAERDRYQRAIKAFARRPLDRQSGMQAYVALAQDGGPARITVYLAFECYAESPSHHAAHNPKSGNARQIGSAS